MNKSTRYVVYTSDNRTSIVRATMIPGDVIDNKTAFISALPEGKEYVDNNRIFKSKQKAYEYAEPMMTEEKACRQKQIENERQADLMRAMKALGL